MQGQTQEGCPYDDTKQKRDEHTWFAPFIFNSNALAFHHLHYRAIGFHRVYSCG